MYSLALSISRPVSSTLGLSQGFFNLSSRGNMAGNVFCLRGRCSARPSSDFSKASMCVTLGSR